MGDLGTMEYGRCSGAGAWLGGVEYGRCPFLGIYYTLTIQSSPDAGVTITVGLADIDGNQNGTTEFERHYNAGASVSLTAPATHAGKNFSKWTVGGVDQPGNPVSVTMDADKTAVAVYVEPPPVAVLKGIELLRTRIPRHIYDSTTYPNADPAIIGQPIPERYGDLHNVTPDCIDTEAGTWKLNRRAILAIDELRERKTVVMVAGVDYVADLANGEFTLKKTPVLEANTTYYFVLESDLAIDGANYLVFAQDQAGHYAGGSTFSIDGGGAWSAGGGDLFFDILVRDSLSGNEYRLIEDTGEAADWSGWGGWGNGLALRDAAARTRIAQSFTTPASGGPWYLSAIHVWAAVVGSPASTRTTRLSILSAYNPAEVQVGSKSYRAENYPGDADWGYFPLRDEASELSADIRGIKTGGGALMTIPGDIHEDVYRNILGGSASGLNAADLAALQAARTEELAVNLDTDQAFEDFKTKMEAGSIYKMLPSLAGDFALKYHASGEPAGTPHLFESHMKNFRMRRIWKNCFQRCLVKYDQDPTSGTFAVAEASSNIAQYVYNRQETLEVETYLKQAADALQLAEDYLGTDALSTRRLHLQYPTREVEFDVSCGYGYTLIPTQKIKITRSRADYTGGALAGVLFRVLEVTKNPGGWDHVKAVLDEMTY